MSDALAWAALAANPIVGLVGHWTGRRATRDEHDVGEQQVGVAYVKQALAGLNQYADRLRSEIGEVRDELATAQTQIGELTDTLGTERARHADELARITAELNTAYASLAERDRELAEAHEAIADLQQQVNTAIGLLVREGRVPPPPRRAQMPGGTTS